MLFGQLHDRSQLTEENDPALSPLLDPSNQAGQKTTRRDFFRYSNRQFMILISTLSLCFAVNRHNNIDDLIFILGFIMSPTFLWGLLILLALLFMVWNLR
ncbi:hypothetical protein SAMN05444166_4832 [Singulisphaera sp. GP187]|uniref:hypothetical protein n=1 Tax=Singulisphaera sp. GP187 TaxID=1882752 RepID=UPI0009264506|nr:hypothetical protein [Singulisphaera sp. GP187]SIO45076.1 hypothetical protein SAMN05444166_4832 [Singulisphaera sp. GP187]